MIFTLLLVAATATPNVVVQADDRARRDALPAREAHFGEGSAEAPSAAPLLATAVVQVDDDALRGSLLLALVDDGHGVTADPAMATHEVSVVAIEGGGFVVTCAGLDTKGASVPSGTPRLVELELRHRVASLVRQTRPRAAAEHPRVALTLIDNVFDGFGERFTAALVDAGVSLAPPTGAAALLCITADADVVRISWGATDDRCTGRSIALDRLDLLPRVAVAEALRLGGATLPALGILGTRRDRGVPALSGAEVEALVRSTTPRPAAPARAADARAVELAGPPLRETRAWAALRAGGLGREAAVDPLVGIAAAFPIAQNVGPALVVDASAGVLPLLIGETFFGGGAAAVLKLSDDVRVVLGLVVGGWLHGWWFDADDAGFALDPAFAVPAAVDVRLDDVMSVSVGLQAGALQRRRVHEIRGEAVWARGPIFLEITAGVSFDIPRGATAVEKSHRPARGEGG